MLEICNYCKKRISKSPTDIKNNNFVFCSRKCYFKFRKENPHLYQNFYKGGNIGRTLLLKNLIKKGE